MPSYAETMAGNLQPDGTQGIAKVGLIDGSTLIAELVGCVIHLSKKDKSLRNILKVETNCKMEYFIFVPWFHSCRPTEMNENGTKIKVKLHRYRNKRKEIELLVDEDNSKTIFENYHSDNYFVIPCPELKNFQKSSFFKKWSSDLLLHNNSSQISPRENSFCGFKKDETSFKYCRFDKEFNKLEKQGVLLIRPSIYESYVIGCYKKENGRIKKYCFLLKGLEEIAEPARGTDNPPPDQPSSGRIEEERDNPPLQHPPSGRIEGRMDIPTLEQSPAGRIEEERGNPPLQHPPSGRIEGRTDNPTLEQSPSGRIEEERDNPPLQQPTSGRIEGRTDNSQESEDGPIGSKLVLVSGRHTSRPMNPEEERAKTEKKELIHKTYGPKVEDMPHDVTHEVCLMLNPIQRLKAYDYRKVAEEIGLKYYQRENLAKENPMEDVFKVMIGQAKKVDEFVDILFKIGRKDVVSMMYDMATH